MVIDNDDFDLCVQQITLLGDRIQGKQQLLWSIEHRNDDA
jgi:hypothetical protein